MVLLNCVALCSYLAYPHRHKWGGQNDRNTCLSIHPIKSNVVTNITDPGFNATVAAAVCFVCFVFHINNFTL